MNIYDVLHVHPLAIHHFCQFPVVPNKKTFKKNNLLLQDTLWASLGRQSPNWPPPLTTLLPVPFRELKLPGGPKPEKPNNGRRGHNEKMVEIGKQGESSVLKLPDTFIPGFGFLLVQVFRCSFIMGRGLGCHLPPPRNEKGMIEGSAGGS